MGAAAPLSLAAAGLSVAGSIFGGFSQARGDEYDAQQAENAATIGKTTAAQTSTYMTQDLDRQVQTIQAIKAGQSIEGNSPTNEAIVNSVQARGQQQIGVKVGNILDQVSQDQSAAALYTSNASSAIMGGFLGGFGGLGKAFGGGANAMNFSLPGGI